MKRYGTVLVFKPGIEREEIQEALEDMVGLLDGDCWLEQTPPINEFDDQYGGPVWYIP